MKIEPSSEAMLALFESQEAMLDRMVSDFRSGRHPALPWSLVPARDILRIWRDAAREGLVRDLRGLARIEAIMVDNVLKLAVNTEISGHTPVQPEDALGGRFEKDEIDAFVEWAIEIPNGWRISDYGLDPLFKLAALATETADPRQKMAVLDLMFNVCHQRSDLAGWFVEGGSRTLSQLSDVERPGTAPADATSAYAP